MSLKATGTGRLLTLTHSFSFYLSLSLPCHMYECIMNNVFNQRIVPCVVLLGVKLQNTGLTIVPFDQG